MGDEVGSSLSSSQQEILGAHPQNFPSGGVLIGGQVFYNPNQLEGVQNNLRALDQTYKLRASGQDQNGIDSRTASNPSGQQFSSTQDALFNGRGVAPSASVGPLQSSSYDLRNLSTGAQNPRVSGPAYQSPGVYATQQGQLPAGTQLVITEGAKASTAGEFIDRLQGTAFAPGRLTDYNLNTRTNNPQYSYTVTTKRPPILPQDFLAAQNQKQLKPAQPPGMDLHDAIPTNHLGFGPGRGNLGTNHLELSESPRFQAVSKVSDFVSNYQKGFEVRQANLDKFLSNLSGGGGTLFRDRSTLGKIGQTGAAIGLGIGSLGAFYLVPVADASFVAAQKSFLYTGALITPETKLAAIQELKDNAQVLKQVYTDPYTLTTAAAFAGLGYQGAKNNILVRTALPKLYPEKFVPIEKTGINFVEANTIPTKLGELQSLEGNNAVPTTHVTISKLPFNDQGEFVTQAMPSGAGGLRSAYNLFNFYKASPEVEQGVLTPRAYLGYAGIKSDLVNSPDSGAVVFGKPTVRILQFTDVVSKTPSSIKGIEAINKFQIQQSGKTFVPAENFMGKSIEGQFITPSKYTNPETGAPLPGFENINTPGSIIKQTGPSKFTFYKQELPKVFGVIPRSRYFKFEIIPAKTSEVLSTDVSILPKNTLDIGKYNEEYSQGLTIKSIRSPTIVSNVRTPLFSASPDTEVLSPSMSVSQSLSSSLSPSDSLSSSLSVSPSPSFSLSPSDSLLPSPSPSPSPSDSLVPSFSPSPSPSPSQSISVSPSPSISPSSSVSPSFIPTLPRTKTPGELPAIFKLETKRQKHPKKNPFSQRVFLNTPTFVAADLGIEGKPSKGLFGKNLGIRPVTPFKYRRGNDALSELFGVKRGRR